MKYFAVDISKYSMQLFEIVKKMEHKGCVNKQRRLPRGEGYSIAGFEGLGFEWDYLINDVD